MANRKKLIKRKNSLIIANNRCLLLNTSNTYTGYRYTDRRVRTKNKFMGVEEWCTLMTWHFLLPIVPPKTTMGRWRRLTCSLNASTIRSWLCCTVFTSETPGLSGVSSTMAANRPTSVSVSDKPLKDVTNWNTSVAKSTYG